MSTIEVNTIKSISGTSTLTIGESGDTIALTSGAKTSGFGKIGQVVRNSSTTSKSTNSTSISELINVSITPTSTTSKIVILVNVMMQVIANNNAFSAIKLFRGTTSDTALQEYYFGAQVAQNRNDLYSVNYIDEPSTTSSQQYTVGFRKASTDTTTARTDGGHYEITLMEILD